MIEQYSKNAFQETILASSSASDGGLGGVLGEEGARVGILVEFGWVWAHEDISHDEVVEAFWGCHGLDSEQALGLSELGDLEDVVLGFEDVVS